MLTKYEQTEAIVAKIMAEKRAARAARLAQRRAEAKAKHERIMVDWREYACMYHVFVHLERNSYFVWENKLDDMDFRTYIDDPEFYHCVVRGRNRANIVAQYVINNPAAALAGENVIALAFAK